MTLKISISKALYITLFSICLLFNGCSMSESDKEYTSETYDDFLEQVFIQEVQSDSITLNYTLTQPEKYGIADFQPTLGDYSQASMKESCAVLENYKETLKKFPYKELSYTQQTAYDVLMEYFDTALSAGNLSLYSEVLGPTTGIQAQLPVLLSEYHFNDKEDIEHYLSLLSCVEDYFSQIISFEKEKSAAGLFMSRHTADQIIKQCRLFIAAKEDNAMIEVFNDRMDSLSFVSAAEKSAYKDMNREKVLKEVIPAYKLLIKGLKKLKDTGVNENGLCYFPEGKEYYEYIIRYNLGTDKSIDEIRDGLEKTIDENIMNIQTMVSADPGLIEKVSSTVFPMTDPVEILEYLKEDINDIYPSIKPVDYTVKYVHKSLEEHLSPAFYLTPPIDNFEDNSIYINGHSAYDLSTIFTTLAHEGYPGHLYQTVYYSQQNPYPIRDLYGCGGYSEGWATYVEFDSYERAGLDEALAKLLKYNKIATFCMYSVIDLGVNYYGWTLKDTEKYLTKFGITQNEIIDKIHYAMIEEPGNYLKYSGGYVEIMELRKKAEKKLGDSFDLKAFHKFFLDFGPAPFKVIGKHLDKWIKTTK